MEYQPTGERFITEADMKCENCGKTYSTKKSPHVLKDGILVAVSFCSYECYLKFWAECKNFVPLPEYIKPENKEERI